MKTLFITIQNGKFLRFNGMGQNIGEIKLFNEAINIHFMLQFGQKFQHFNESKRDLYTIQLLQIIVKC